MMPMDVSIAERIAAQVVADFRRGIQFTGAFHGYPVWEVCLMMLRVVQEGDTIGNAPKTELAVTGMLSAVRLLNEQNANFSNHEFTPEAAEYYIHMMRVEIDACRELLDYYFEYREETHGS